MKLVVSIIVFLFALSGCEEPPKIRTPEMEKEARNLVLQYLAKEKLPLEGLKVFKSSVSNEPDFSYLYTGGGRCIEFVVYCHVQHCYERHLYPYYEHGDPCPEQGN